MGNSPTADNWTSAMVSGPPEQPVPPGLPRHAITALVDTLTVARRSGTAAAHWICVRSPLACAICSHNGRFRLTLATTSGTETCAASFRPSCAVVAVVFHVPSGYCLAGPTATFGGWMMYIEPP